MCKQLLDLLHPFNIFGKKIKHVTYDTTDTPIVDDEKQFTIDWAGDALEVAYTVHHFHRIVPHRIDRYEAIKESFSGGGTEIITAPAFRRTPANYDEIEGNILYFKCINVRSLVVNGEQLI